MAATSGRLVGLAEVLPGDAVHAEREHDAPQRCLVTQRDVVHDVAPDAGGDESRDEPAAEGPEDDRGAGDQAARRNRHRGVRHLHDASTATTVIAVAPIDTQYGGVSSTGRRS